MKSDGFGVVFFVSMAVFFFFVGILFDNSPLGDMHSMSRVAYFGSVMVMVFTGMLVYATIRDNKNVKRGVRE